MAWIDEVLPVPRALPLASTDARDSRTVEAAIDHGWRPSGHDSVARVTGYAVPRRERVNAAQRSDRATLAELIGGTERSHRTRMDHRPAGQ